MDDNFISFEQTSRPSENSRQRFWSLSMRKKIVHDEEPESCNDLTPDVDTSSATNSWRSRKNSNTMKNRNDRIGKKNVKEKKKGRLSIWKGWLLALLKSKSKSSLKKSSLEEINDPDLFDLSCVPSLTKNSEPWNVTTDAILNTFRESKVKEPHLGMTITLPAGVPGKDIKINVELKVLPKAEEPNMPSNTKGICMLKIMESGPVYSGIVKVPSGTNIFKVAQMPLYFLSGDSTDERIVETIIKPVDNLLPENYDKTMLIEEIHLRLHFETQLRFNQPHLKHEFLDGVIPVVEHGPEQNCTQNSQISFGFPASLMSLNTGDLIDQITSEASSSFDESSKTLVKEILNQVVSKLSFKSSTDLIEDLHKELEVQKILLLETTSSILPNTESLLSKISETEQENTSTSSRTFSKTSSKTSSKNLVPEMIKSSEFSLPQTRSSSNQNLESRYHLIVPSNTPDAFASSLKHAEEQKRLAQKRMIKADIDKTLDLLETAKNKLINYLNQEENLEETISKIMDDGFDQAKIADSGKIIVDPFKNLEKVEFFPETQKMQEPDIKTEDKKDVVKDEHPVPDSSSNPEAEEPSESQQEVQDEVELKVTESESPSYTELTTSDFSDESVIKEGPKNHPVHELKHMLLAELRTKTDFEPTVTDDEVFDLENLAHANIFLDDDEIMTMTDAYLSDDEISHLDEYYIHSLNSHIFRERYDPERDSSLPPIDQELLKHDINIMIRELIEHTEIIKDYAIDKEEKEASNAMVEDVKQVLEQLIQRVEEQVSLPEHQAPQLSIAPQVYQVKPVYFCLIDDYVDVFPTAGHADGNPIAWLAHRLRATAATERKSTVTVRRCLANGQRNAEGFHAEHISGLLQKLEKGALYLSELCKEIYTRPLKITQMEDFDCNHFAMEKAKEASIPIIRKSRKIINFDSTKTAEAKQTTRESVEEKLEKVINPEKEAPKAFKMHNNEENNQRTDLSQWPAWKREWIKIFTQHHTSNEAEGLRQLTDLVKIKNTFDQLPKLKLIDMIRCSAQNTSKKMPKKSLRIKPFVTEKDCNVNLMNSSSKPNLKPSINDSDESIDSITNQIKKVYFADSDEDVPKKKVTEKKGFKSCNVPPHYFTDDAIPSTSTANDQDLILLHTEKHNGTFVSREQVPAFSENFSNEKIFQPVADVPRRFASSSTEQAYLNNIAVLHHKLYRASTTTLYSTSSSDGSYQKLPKVYPKTAPTHNSSTGSMVTHYTEASNVNHLGYSTSASEVSSRSAASPPQTIDYDADLDAYEQILPDLRPEYISKPELNRPDEVALIEENVLKNDRLNPQMKSLSEAATSTLFRWNSSAEFLSSTTSLSLNSSPDLDQRGRS